MNSVLTYIFGENTDRLRNPLIQDEDTEYICVTDNPSLRSDVWKIIVDPLSSIADNRLKFAYIKFHPFEYTNGTNVAVIDGTIVQVNSLKSAFNSVGDQLLLKLHPTRDNLLDEVVAWVKYRNLSQECMSNFICMCTALGCSAKKGPLYETCVSIWNRNNINQLFGDAVFKTMNKLTDTQGNIFKSNQLVATMLLNSRFKNRCNVGLIDQNDYFIRYQHGSNKINPT